MKNDKKEAQKRRSKILKTKYPGHRFRDNMYDDFHVYDLVDEMNMAKHDHRVLLKGYRWAIGDPLLEETEI